MSHSPSQENELDSRGFKYVGIQDGEIDLQEFMRIMRAGSDQMVSALNRASEASAKAIARRQEALKNRSPIGVKKQGGLNHDGEYLESWIALQSGRVSPTKPTKQETRDVGPCEALTKCMR